MFPKFFIGKSTHSWPHRLCKAVIDFLGVKILQKTNDSRAGISHHTVTNMKISTKTGRLVELQYPPQETKKVEKITIPNEKMARLAPALTRKQVLFDF